MADKVTNSLDFKIDFTFQLNSNQKTRSITFPIVGKTAENVSDWWKNTFYDKFFANYKWIVQPTGWRDSDDTEEAYECTEIVGTIISQTETQLGV